MRIPVKADIDTQNAFRDIEQEINALWRDVEASTRAITELEQAFRRLADATATAATTQSINREMQFVDAADLGAGNSPPGSILTSDGAGSPSWAPPLGGLVTVGEAGEGGRSVAQQVLGVNGSLAVLNALSADSVRCRTFWAQTHGGLDENHGGTIVNTTGLTAGANVITWIAPYACRVTALKGYRVGGTGATVNARRNGTNAHLASDLSLTSTDTWMDGGTVQNTTYAAGDKLEIQAVTVAGSPTQVAVSVYFTRD